MWIGIVLAWIILSILAGVGAKNKGRSFAGFFFLSLLLSPVIGLIAMAVVKTVEKKEEPSTAEAAPEQPPPDPGFEEIACPSCGKPKKRGQMCPHCGSWQG